MLQPSLPPLPPKPLHFLCAYIHAHAQTHAHTYVKGGQTHPMKNFLSMPLFVMNFNLDLRLLL